MRIVTTLCAAIWLIHFANAVCLSDHLTLEIDGVTHELDGEILIEAQDQSLYFRQDNGKIWFVQPQEIRNRVDEQEVIEPASKEKIAEQLLAELPEGFRIYETKHFVIAYQTELAYARWVGGLYESKLYRGFETFFQKRKKLELSEPEFPLVAIIFGSKAEYQRYMDRELGPGQEMIAYYNVQTNRVTMYDLTSDRRAPGREMNDRQINQVLQNPAAVMMVATIIHEGTHQLIFNRGVQTRFADCPLWVNEGLAMYFEAPNVRSKRGWQKPGMIFDQRLFRFLDYLGRRPVDSLESLITSDDRLRNQATSVDAYAEAWALNHFLMTKKSKEYVAYLEHLSQQKALVKLTPEQRLADFRQYISADLKSLDAEFLEYIQKLRR